MVAENPNVPLRVQMDAVLQASCRRAALKGPITSNEEAWINSVPGVSPDIMKQVVLLKRRDPDK